jgi:5-methyltetrahydrofolate corrinoid/iron sulfur protein methyltransferase
MRLIADNLQITNPDIEKAVAGFHPDPVQELVLACEKAGADMIDINVGPLPRDGDKKMEFLVNAVQEVSDLPILLDTANPRAIEAGLKAGRNHVMINGFSPEPNKVEFILPLAKKYDADIIGYLLDPGGQVLPGADERLQVAVELLAAFQKAGIDEERLIIDPLVVPVNWQDGHLQAGEVLQTIRNLPDVLGYKIRTVVGLSNLTAGAGHRPGRRLLEQVYLSMLAAAGLDMVLLNIFHAETAASAKAADALISQKPFAWNGWGSVMNSDN